MTDEKRREVRVALDEAIAERGSPPGQEHTAALYVDVLAGVVEKCGVTQEDVLDVNRQRWRELKAA